MVGLPSFLDERVTDLVNKELEAKRAELSWSFGKTLRHVFALPASFEPFERLMTSVIKARVQINPRFLSLAIQLATVIAREESSAPALKA